MSSRNILLFPLQQQSFTALYSLLYSYSNPHPKHCTLYCTFCKIQNFARRFEDSNRACRHASDSNQTSRHLADDTLLQWSMKQYMENSCSDGKRPVTVIYQNFLFLEFGTQNVRSSVHLPSSTVLFKNKAPCNLAGNVVSLLSTE